MKINRVLAIIAKTAGHTWSEEVRELARAYLLARLKLAMLTRGPLITPATTALLRTIGDMDETPNAAPVTDTSEEA